MHLCVYRNIRLLAKKTQIYTSIHYTEDLLIFFALIFLEVFKFFLSMSLLLRAILNVLGSFCVPFSEGAEEDTCDVSLIHGKGGKYHHQHGAQDWGE